MEKTTAIIKRIFTRLSRRPEPERVMEWVLAGSESAQLLMAELALNEKNPKACYYVGKIYSLVGERVESYAWYCLASHFSACRKMPEAIEAMKQHQLSKEEVFLALQRSAELQDSVFVKG